MQERDLLTTAEAAEALGKSVRTIQYYVQIGKLTPAVQAPGKQGAFFFDRDDVLAIGPGAEPSVKLP